MTAAGRASSDPGVDRARLAGVLGGALYSLSGGVVLLTMALLPDAVDKRILGLVAASAVVIGLVLVIAPWGRLRGWLPSALVVVAHAHLALAGVLVPGAIEHYLPLYILSYLYLGMTQRPGTAFAFIPLSVLSFATATSAGSVNTVNFLVAIPVALIGAEILSRLQRLQQSQFDEVAKVLDATKELVVAESVDDAARVIGELAQDLVAADAVTVLVADTEHPSRFVARMRSDALAALDVISIDIDAESSGVGVAVRSGQTLSVPDAATSPTVSRRYVEATGAQSVAYVPLFDAGTAVGVIVALWHRSGVRLVGSAAQVIELVAAEAGPTLSRLRDRDRLSWEAETDALTGLANRRTFNRALDRSTSGDALVMIDLDRFKRVNDDYGHAIGDDVLRAMGSCLTRAAREGDCVARFGGEEFAAILPRAGTDGVRSFLGRLRGHWNETEPLTTFSAGFAVRGPAEAALLTLGRADGALYEAKALGRNRDVEASSSTLARP